MVDCPSCLRAGRRLRLYWARKDELVYGCACGNVWIEPERTPTCAACAYPLDLLERGGVLGYSCGPCRQFDREGACAPAPPGLDYWCLHPPLGAPATPGPGIPPDQ